MGRIPIKNAAQIEKMRAACALTAQILDAVGEIVKAGVSTEDINTFIHTMTLEHGAIPATLNYKGFTKSCCTSINDVICHGIPSPYELLKDGDIINIDVTSVVDGYFGDSSRMYLVGGPAASSPAARELVTVTRQALFAGIHEIAPGKNVGDIGAGIQEFIESTGRGYGIVREYTGHGIGESFHEPPQVVHVGRRGSGPELKPGMTFTVEPMINEGTHRTVLSKMDGWTVRTADGKLSAQWEHTVLVTETGYELLTLGSGEEEPVLP